MKKREISDVTSDIRSAVEKLDALGRSYGYIFDTLKESKVPFSYEAETIEVLQNIEKDYLICINNLSDELDAIVETGGC